MEKDRLPLYGFTVADLPRYAHIEEAVVQWAARLWAAVGVKPVITSSYRTAAENQSAQGVSQSQHLKGRALDLDFPGVDPVRVIDAAEKLGVPGLALQWPTGNVHIDARSGQRARWGEKVEKSGSLVVKSHNHALAEILGLFAAASGIGPIPIPQTAVGKVGASVLVVGALTLAVVLLVTR